MGIVTEPGFYNGKFLKGGQFSEPQVEDVRTGISVDASDAGSVPDLDKMTKDELVAEAERRGIEVKTSDTKAEIAAVLRA